MSSYYSGNGVSVHTYENYDLLDEDRRRGIVKIEEVRGCGGTITYYHHADGSVTSDYERD